MKKIGILALAVSALIFSGCEELEDLCGITAEDLGFTEDYTTQLNAAVYMYQQVDRAMRSDALKNNGTAIIDNAECTRDADSVIVDFGNGTIGADGVTRTGSYRIAYSGDYMQPNSTASMTLKDYLDGDQSYTGTLMLTNVSGGGDPEIEAIVGDLTTDSLKLGGTINAKWIAGFATTEDATDDKFQLAGGLVLTNVNSNDTFTGNMTTPVVVENSCNVSFVEGVIDIVPSNVDLPTVMLDFIPGDCNNLFNATVSCEGNTLTIPFPIK